jgi:hypothetical protein
MKRIGILNSGNNINSKVRMRDSAEYWVIYSKDLG